MPNLREAAVAVIGQVIEIEGLFKYDDKSQTRTTEKDGVRVLLSTPDGFAQIKVAQLDLDIARPVVGNWAAYLVRYGAWGREGRAGDANVSCRFLSLVDDEFAGRLGGVLQAGKKAA